jgi:uncharacterized membrane protein (DUF373 family)
MFVFERACVCTRTVLPEVDIYRDLTERISTLFLPTTHADHIRHIKELQGISMEKPKEESLAAYEHDPLIRWLNKAVIFSVKILAVLITIVIFWGVLDVIVHLYNQFMIVTTGVFNAENLVAILGTFLAVLIAIEIFLNIIFYLKKDTLHVHLVLATALTAVARKVIVFDYSVINPQYIYGTAAVIVAIGIAYWLVSKTQQTD